MMSRALLLLAVGVVCEAKTLRWYMLGENIDVNIQFARENRAAMSGFYGCCGGVNVDADGTMTANVADLTNQTVQYHKEGLTYHLIGKVNETGVKNGNVVKAVEQIANLVKTTGAEGIIFDYEPTDNATTEHAQLYANFLAALKKAAGPTIDVGMDVSGWGILDYFSVYAAAGLDIYTSMSTTYYADSALSDTGMYFIGNMTQYFGADHSFFGIGTWDTDPSTCKWDYGWNSTSLQTFLNRYQPPHIDLWRCDIDHYATPSPDMIKTLQAWYQQ